MGAGGEEPRRLVAPERKGFPVDHVQWSPDGRRIAYLSVHLGPEKSECAIEVRDLNGGPPALILSDPKLCGRYRVFSWLPDGRMIYSLAESGFNAYRSNLWEIRVDPRTGRVSGEPRRITNWVDASFFDISVTADGKRLAFVRRYDQSDVYVARVERNGRLDAPRRLTLDDRIDWPGGWTRDSKNVLFYSDRSRNLDIFRQGIEDRSAEAIVEGPEEKRAPQLSADGAWILYLTWPRMQRGEFPRSGHLMRIPLSGGSPEVVFTVSGYPGSAEGLRFPYILTTRGYPDFHCSRTPANSCVLAEAEQEQIVFYGFDPAQGSKHQLARIDTDHSNSFWDLSPDGSRIAFVKYDDHRGSIRVLPLAGGPEREVSAQGWASLDSVAWSADGKSLFVTSHSLTGSRLLRVYLNGETQFLHKANYLAERPVPSPDGTYLAFGEVTSESNAWMIENF